MKIPGRVARYALSHLERRPHIKAAVKAVDLNATRAIHSAAALVPPLIRPQPRLLTVAITAHCNLRCAGCRYGRDFMQGAQLSVTEVSEILQASRTAGVLRTRLYGGEPLLHPDLADMIASARSLGISPYLTSNGVLLDQKIDKLYAAGLRLVTIGFYGFEQNGAGYAGRSSYLERLNQSLSYTRSRYGKDLELQLNYVAVKPTCKAETWRAAWRLANKYDMHFHVDLSSYSTPFFVKDADVDLALTEEDRPQIEKMVGEMLAYKDADPRRFLHSKHFIRSIPDWLILGANMRVPCDAYQHIWVGADGTVQLCDTAFPLGNIRTESFESILFSRAHKGAAIDAFRLKCPNCTCHADARIRKHLPSVRKYNA